MLERRSNLQKLNGPLAPGIKLVSADNLQMWLMDIQVMDANPIYAGQTYRLQFRFSPSYPIGTRTPFFVTSDMEINPSFV